jgi:hypothetical protein
MYPQNILIIVKLNQIYNKDYLVKSEVIFFTSIAFFALPRRGELVAEFAFTCCSYNFHSLKNK